MCVMFILIPFCLFKQPSGVGKFFDSRACSARLFLYGVAPLANFQCTYFRFQENTIKNPSLVKMSNHYLALHSRCN